MACVRKSGAKLQKKFVSLRVFVVKSVIYTSFYSLCGYKTTLLSIYFGNCNAKCPVFGRCDDMPKLIVSSVHLVLRMSFAIGFEVVGSNVDKALSCFGCSPCYVWRDVGVGCFEQWIVGVGWLGRQHVGSKCSN